MSEGFKNLVVTYKKGELIYNTGENSSTMFIISSGTVKLFKKAKNNKEIELGIYKKGGFFGELAVIDSLKRNENAVALEDCQLIAINKSVFKTMLKKNPDIAMKMIQKFSDKLIETNKKIDQLLSSTVPTQTTEYGSIKILGYNQVFPINMKKCLVGRYDPVIGICPDIDISSFDPQKTVSRKHAVILKTDEGSYIEEEVGVINGTYLNGEKLEPGKRYKIKGSDKVHFGLVACEFLE